MTTNQPRYYSAAVGASPLLQLRCHTLNYINSSRFYSHQPCCSFTKDNHEREEPRDSTYQYMASSFGRVPNMASIKLSTYTGGNQKHDKDYGCELSVEIDASIRNADRELIQTRDCPEGIEAPDFSLRLEWNNNI